MDKIFPNELLVTLEEDPGIFHQQVLAYTVCQLYDRGRITGHEGARMLDCDLWEFYRILSENNSANLTQPEQPVDQAH